MLITLAACAAPPPAASASETAATKAIGAEHATTFEVGSQHRFTRPAHDRDRFLQLLGSDADAYTSHIFTLANPFFEGRCPGTIGNDLTAEYIEFYFEHLGLEPAFAQPIATAEAATIRALPSYRQPFSVGGTIATDTQQMTVFTAEGHYPMLPGEDFTLLGVSGNENATGEVVFIGYGIEKGPGGYSSFTEDTDLTDKIALLLRFEPMDDQGRSLWAEGKERWSKHAGLMSKFRAVAKRGAAGILLVAPSAADDPRTGALQAPAETRIGKPLSIPILLVSHDTAELICKHGDTDGRDLPALRRYADAGGKPIPFDGVDASIAAALHTEELVTNNVAAILPGKGELADQYIVIGAHYDHLGYGHFGSRERGADGMLHVGADDNASGVAGTLLLAQRFSVLYDKLPTDQPARSLLFVLFSGEEMGLLGSSHFVSNSPVPIDRIYACLNMDMIGDLRDDKTVVFGVGTAEEFGEVLDPVFASSPLQVDARPGSSGRSDEASFHRKQIPGLHFFSGGHKRYHTTRDTAATINVPGALKILDLVEAVTTTLASRADSLTYKKAGGKAPTTRRSQIKVRFGITPAGHGEAAHGVLVGEVFEGTSASNAGVVKGDRIIRWAGEDVADIGAWMTKLKEHEPGDEVDIVVLRDGEEVTLHVVLLAPE
ncbi:MAG: M28 family peptidase [Phycisphaerales bacterium]|nr:M28 family peptidase [Phycisphaerales bacterium]